MNTLMRRFPLYLFFLLALGCTSGTGVSESISPNSALFDPTTSTLPLPNILATATAKDPITQFTDPATGNVGIRPAGLPLNPLEALAYVNLYEVGASNAVSGINAPIYIRFAAPLIPSTVNASNVKVFQITADSASPTATENNPLGFSDVTGMFRFSYTPGSSDLSLFPNFPLLPATRYLYLVSNRVKDAATGGSVSGSVYFDALKSTLALGGPFAALEPIRADALDASGANILLSGYAKVMNDLIAAAPVTTVTGRDQIALLGRFITTAAGFVATDPHNPITSLLPVESALRAFAAGSVLPGGLSGKSWLGAGGLNPVIVTTPAGLTPGQYWANVTGALAVAPASVAAVVTGTFAGADISMNPVVAHNNPAINLNVPFGRYSAATAVVQPFRDPSSGALTGYYYSDRQIPFVYLVPAGNAPAKGWPLAIFQHGINGQKEQVIAVAGALTTAGFAVVAIDLPLHGELAVPGHTSDTLWGQDFVALGAPLATRSNVQQAAFNLDRLELTVATPSFGPGAPFAGQGFAALGPNAPNAALKPKFVGISLGSMIGAYYLAGNCTLNPTPGQPPYSQGTLAADMKGFLSVPGGQLAYLLRDSVDFGPSINAGLAGKGIAVGTPTYNQFFLLTQTVIDPVDPATMTTPLPNLQSADLLPSRLSGRIAVQEATSTSFDAAGTPLNGDLVVPNANSRYFGNALGGRGVLGSPAAFAVAPGFEQLSYASGRVPALFMFTLTGGGLQPKSAPAASSATAAGPEEGYFQFDQADVSHALLIDQTGSPVSNQLAQRQMVYFVLTGLVVDPTVTSAALPKVTVGAGTVRSWKVTPPAAMKIFGY